MIVAACGKDDAQHSDVRAAATQHADDADASVDASSATTGRGSATNNDATGTESGSGTGSGTPAGAGSNTAVSGKTYFNTVVNKLFDSNCSGCHADPRANPASRGPLTIFSYGAMKALLDGNSAADSALMKKLRNLVAHGGGNRCQTGGPNATPCLEIATWWQLENGADAGLTGELTAVSLSGEVTGYAVKTNDTATTLAVDLQIDGATVLSLSADQAAYDAGYDGAHAFKGMLPEKWRDGQTHDVIAVVRQDDKSLALGVAKRFAAYASKAAGKAYFEQTVAPALSACTGCHVVQYDVQYGSLINKAPFLGGTATDNALINRASASVAHPGGKLCASKDGAPCSLFQKWWALEFQ